MKRKLNCPYCFKEIPAKKVSITEKEFDRLKVGSIIISKNGSLRKVEKKSPGFITLLKIMASQYKDPFTSYTYNDIKRNYKLVKV